MNIKCLVLAASLFLMTGCPPPGEGQYRTGTITKITRYIHPVTGQQTAVLEVTDKYGRVFTTWEGDSTPINNSGLKAGSTVNFYICDGLQNKITLTASVMSEETFQIVESEKQ